MAMIDNTLAAQVPTFDPATPLAQAAKIQSMQQENQAAQFKQMQTEIGSEARGLTPFVNTPEFPAKWAETADRMLAKGLMDPQTHQKWRNTPSPLLLKQMITQTEDPTLTFRKEEAGREQKNQDRSFGLQKMQADRTYGLAVRASDRADEGAVTEADDRAAAAAKYGLKSGTMEYNSYVLGGELPKANTTVSDQVAQRRQAAESMGIKPGHPAYESYALTGKMPREDAQPLSAADKKIITAAEDEIPNLQGTIEALKVAKDLNGKTFTGATSGIRGYIGTAVPGGGLLVDKDAAMATSEFGKVMSGEAIKTMAETLKGATTDFEMKKFETMLADPSTPPEIRGRTIDRMITMAERQMELKAKRVSDLRGGTYFKPDSGKPVTKEQYDKLPSGAKFTAPDGSQRVKP